MHKHIPLDKLKEKFDGTLVRTIDEEDNLELFLENEYRDKILMPLLRYYQEQGKIFNLEVTGGSDEEGKDSSLPRKGSAGGCSHGRRDGSTGQPEGNLCGMALRLQEPTRTDSWVTDPFLRKGTGP